MSAISDLPAEVLLNVFAYVRHQPDRKNACLVCRAWPIYVAPDLWRRFRTNLLETPTKHLRDLIQPSNGVLHHIRQLSIGSIKEAGRDRKADSKAANDNLRLLLAALPRNQLGYFKFSLDLDRRNFFLVLESQQHLLSFRPSLLCSTAESDPPFDPIEPTHAPWVATALSQVKLFGIAPPKPASDTESLRYRQNLKAQFTRLPKVNHLILWPRHYGTPIRDIPQDIFGLATAPSTSQELLKLEQLEIAYVDFLADAAMIPSCIDVSSLKSLRLFYCRNFIPILPALQYKLRNSDCNLTELEIELSYHRRRSFGVIPQVVDSLLFSFSGLRIFKVNAGKNLIDPSAIIHHGDTLRVLMVHNSRRDGTYSRYDSATLGRILSACAHLEELGVSFPAVNKKSLPTLDLSFGLTPRKEDAGHSHTEIETTLITIASSNSLHTLRILTLPTYGTLNMVQHARINAIIGSDVYYLQISLQQYATQLLQFLDRHGSKIKVLAIQPPYIWKAGLKEREYDMNGHQFPRYNYVKGFGTDAMGRREIDAVPLKCIAEVPGSRLLYYL